MIQVLGRNNSINVQKVMWCAAELDVEVVRHDIGMNLVETIRRNISPKIQTA